MLPTDEALAEHEKLEAPKGGGGGGEARRVRRGNAFSTWLQLLLCGGTGTVLNASHLAMQIAVVKQKAKSACGGLWVLHLSRLQCVLSPSAAVGLFHLMQG